MKRRWMTMVLLAICGVAGCQIEESPRGRSELDQELTQEADQGLCGVQGPEAVPWNGKAPPATDSPTARIVLYPSWTKQGEYTAARADYDTATIDWVVRLSSSDVGKFIHVVGAGEGVHGAIDLGPRVPPPPRPITEWDLVMNIAEQYSIARKVAWANAEACAAGY